MQVVDQINPSRRAVRGKARQASAALIFETPKDAPEGRTIVVRNAFVRSVLSRSARIGVMVAAVTLVPLALASCRSGDVEQAAPTPPAVAAPGAPVRNTTQKASDRKAPFASPPWHIPVGPTLIIEPGKGFGPIRFGATQETIERLIGEPCEEKRNQGDDLVCRYSAQAVDFVLRKGQVVQMRAHRLGRPFKPEVAGSKVDYGIFNGRFAGGVALGMLPAAVRELLGAPKQVRPVTGDNPNHTVELHDYGTFSLEFDRLPSGSVVLGGLTLEAPTP
jgi:hypothetical protein